jgi:C4-dicarboxylate transporter DctM subunit
MITGCFISETPVMVIMMPIFLPAVIALKIDPIHFGIIFMLNHAIGMMTPPYGVNIFVTCSIAEISIHEYCRQVLPFIIPLLISLALLTYIPEITLFLPKLLSR